MQDANCQTRPPATEKHQFTYLNVVHLKLRLAIAEVRDVLAVRIEIVYSLFCFFHVLRSYGGYNGGAGYLDVWSGWVAA